MLQGNFDALWSDRSIELIIGTPTWMVAADPFDPRVALACSLTVALLFSLLLLLLHFVSSASQSIDLPIFAYFVLLSSRVFSEFRPAGMLYTHMLRAERSFARDLGTWRAN